jgi:hypothetical protein
MSDPTFFNNLSLLSGYILIQVEVTSEPLVDAIGREAIARSQIVGREIRITMRSNLDEKEFSVTLYHEILEAITVAVPSPPVSLVEFQ